MNNNAAIVDYPAAGPNPETTIRAQIISGRGGAGLGKNWDGFGITSSQAAADAVNSAAVGYAVNGSLPLGPYTTFAGQPVDPSSVLMRYTRTGDANLDGLVDNNDVTIVGANYAPDSAKPFWALGDFDYNGFVDNGWAYITTQARHRLAIPQQSPPYLNRQACSFLPADYPPSFYSEFADPHVVLPASRERLIGSNAKRCNPSIPPRSRPNLVLF
jgi:hypothetical protein